jgi:hypothetical protein
MEEAAERNSASSLFVSMPHCYASRGIDKVLLASLRYAVQCTVHGADDIVVAAIDRDMVRFVWPCYAIDSDIVCLIRFTRLAWLSCPLCRN